MPESGPPSGSTLCLEARSISKRFGGITALHDISISVEPGEILGLVGPNGAGKTTLFQLPERATPPGGGEHLVLRRAARSHARLQQSPAGYREDLPAGGDLPGIDRLRALLVADGAKKGDARFWRDLLNMSRVTKAEQAKA